MLARKIISKCSQQQPFLIYSRRFNNTASTFQRRNINTNTTTMGVSKEIIKEGNGSKPSKGQEVTVHCTGYGKNRDLTKVFWCKLRTVVLYSAVPHSTVHARDVMR